MRVFETTAWIPMTMSSTSKSIWVPHLVVGVGVGVGVNVTAYLAGQERYRSLTQSYYRGASGALVFFDVTNPASFDNVESWCVILVLVSFLHPFLTTGVVMQNEILDRIATNSGTRLPPVLMCCFHLLAERQKRQAKKEPGAFAVHTVLSQIR